MFFKINLNINIILLSLLFVAITAVEAKANVKTITLEPSMDAYIDMKDSDTNFGGTNWLYVGYSPEP